MGEPIIFSLMALLLFAVALPCQSRCFDHLPSLYPSRILHTSSLSLPKNPASIVVDRVSFRRSTLRALSPAPSPLKSPPQNRTHSTPAVKAYPPTPSPTHKSGRAKVGGWFSGIAVGAGAGAITAVVALVGTRLILKHRWGKPVERTIIFQHKWLKSKSLAFLDKKDVFDGMELIGEGGSGKVYRAVLPDGTENGKVVAIKKVIPLLNNANRSPNEVLEKSYDLTKNTKQIHAELKTLGYVRHRNLVTLLAYVPRTDAHLFIYEFMENGSLHDALVKVADGSLNLTWPVRHKIAVGVVTGLKYLHDDCNPRIVHRDIKPGNILLDKEFEPHLGDFGLAKVLPDSFTHFTTENVAGTVGYIAPEYHQTLKYTSKGDIFSFGVVLTVLLIGREPTAEMFSEVQTNMGNWITDVLASGREAVSACLDSSLRNQGFEENMFLAFKIAALCAAQSPSSRPSCSDVLAMLYQISPANILPLPQ